MKNVNFKELKQEYKDLVQSAEEASHKAYNPYSDIAVGAAILTKNNKIIKGANIENASFRLSICAEQSALAQANILGENDFKAIAIISSLEGVITPCGACRQMLFEFFQRSGIDFDIIMSNKDKTKAIIAKVSELLPLAFNLKNFKL